MIGIRAVLVANPYRSAQTIQCAFRGYKARKLWAETFKILRRQREKEDNAEKARLDELKANIEAAEKEKEAALAMKSAGPSSALESKNRLIDALQQTVCDNPPFFFPCPGSLTFYLYF